MTRTDRYRLTIGLILGVLGVIIVVRSLTSHVWPVGLLGMVMIALALYRLKQYRTYRAAVGQ
ncbi:MAG TPA: hypothetical protein VG815_09750 [Chloroflexota bacterium]|nr:hypothetical protein [Chloroflexota bacterium]